MGTNFSWLSNLQKSPDIQPVVMGTGGLHGLYTMVIVIYLIYFWSDSLVKF